MRTVNKSTITEAFIEQIPTIKKVTAKNITEEIFSFVRDELCDGKRFPIPLLGRISVLKKSERPGCNPKTGEHVVIQPRLSVTLTKNSNVVNKTKTKKSLSSRLDFYNRLCEKFNITMIEAKKIHKVFIGFMQMTSNAEVRIEIRGFGVFSGKVRKAMKAKNPKTGAPVDVPPTTRLHFKESKTLRLYLENSGNFGVFNNA